MAKWLQVPGFEAARRLCALIITEQITILLARESSSREKRNGKKLVLLKQSIVSFRIHRKSSPSLSMVPSKCPKGIDSAVCLPILLCLILLAILFFCRLSSRTEFGKSSSQFPIGNAELFPSFFVE